MKQRSREGSDPSGIVKNHLSEEIFSSVYRAAAAGSAVQLFIEIIDIPL